MTTVTPQTMVRRWTSPIARPLFKGSLIDSDGCCCAQGDVLRVCGMSDDDLRAMEQAKADRLVAQSLGISLAESILLREVNDSKEGCPQNVLILADDGIGRILGPNWRVVVAFFRHLDTLTPEDWAAARAAARAAAWAARDAAGECAGISHLSKPFFLPLFFDDVPAFVTKAQAMWPTATA